MTGSTSLINCRDFWETSLANLPEIMEMYTDVMPVAFLINKDGVDVTTDPPSPSGWIVDLVERFKEIRYSTRLRIEHYGQEGQYWTYLEVWRPGEPDVNFELALEFSGRAHGQTVLCAKD